MTTQTPQSAAATHEDQRSHGWLTFAGVLLMLLGTINIIDGAAAIGKAHFYVAHAHYVFGDLETWGWVVLCLGLLQLVVALGVLMRNQLARWSGVVILALNALAQLLMMPSYPFWSLAIFAIDVLALYALIAYGERLSAGRS